MVHNDNMPMTIKSGFMVIGIYLKKEEGFIENQSPSSVSAAKVRTLIWKPQRKAVPIRFTSENRFYPLSISVLYTCLVKKEKIKKAEINNKASVNAS